MAAWVAVARGAVAVAVFVGWAAGGSVVGEGEGGTAVFTRVAVAGVLLVAVATMAVGKLVGVWVT